MADGVPGIVSRRPAATAAPGTQAITAGPASSIPAGSAVAIFVSAVARGAPTMNFPGRRLAGGSSEQQHRSSKNHTSRAESLHHFVLQSRPNELLPQTPGENSIQTFNQREGSVLTRSPGVRGSFSFSSFVRIRRQTPTKVALANPCSALFGVTSDTTIQIRTHRWFGLPRLCRL
jgi:hypothetical protein